MIAIKYLNNSVILTILEDRGCCEIEAWRERRVRKEYNINEESALQQIPHKVLPKFVENYFASFTVTVAVLPSATVTVPSCAFSFSLHAVIL